ncbi:uncharacterized protein LOC143559449 [Bidens hawaiensis]|uniref:uncharacterized protein LOC143559449 n=1 Tax=Bidens hawaiensis TaxID=980011 RepID=UPI00404AB945
MYDQRCRDDVPAEAITIQEGTNSIDIEVGEDKNIDKKKWLRAAAIKGNWSEVESILKEDEGLATQEISSDGSTILHIAVRIGRNDFVKSLFSYINDDQVLQPRDCDGSTALHIAAIVGNKDGAELLVKKNNNLLRSKDNEGKEPLHKAYEKMHLDTIGYLLKADSGIGDPGDKLKVQLLVNAISAKQYSLALEFVQKFPSSASKTDDVLMAIAKTFPTGPDYWETLVYPPCMFLFTILPSTMALCICIPYHTDRVFPNRSTLFRLVELHKDTR